MSFDSFGGFAFVFRFRFFFLIRDMSIRKFTVEVTHKNTSCNLRNDCGLSYPFGSQTRPDMQAECV